MKRLLLLISMFSIVGSSVDGQQLVRSTATPDSKTPYTKSIDDTQDQPKKKKRKKKAKKKHSKKQKEREIDHAAPDQQTIDSIKEEKAKLKK